MSETPGPAESAREGAVGQGADYEYDLAHEWQSPQRRAEEVRAAPVRQAVPQGQDGDYGYDLAHDLPG